MSLQVFSSFCQLSSILVFVSSSPCKMKDHQSRSILLNLGPFNHLEAYDLRDLGHVVFFYQLQYAKLRKFREEKSLKGNTGTFVFIQSIGLIRFSYIPLLSSRPTSDQSKGQHQKRRATTSWVHRSVSMNIARMSLITMRLACSASST